MRALTHLQPWRGFRSVLCPIDFSATSRAALSYAATLAERTGARLSALYVVDPLIKAAAETELRDKHFLRRSQQELGQFIETTLTSQGSRRLRPRLRIAVGSAASEILEQAPGCDVIVMGTNRATGARRVLLGSTTLAVLQRTPIPVIAIPPAEPQHSWRLPSPGEALVVAVDFDGRTRQHVDVAATLAVHLGVSLVLVHVVESIDEPTWMSQALSARQQTQLTRATGEMDRLVAHVTRRVPTTGRVMCGYPPDQIAALVAGTDATLLMTVLRERRGWFGSRKGALSYHVLSHAVTPVLACPPQWHPR